MKKSDFFYNLPEELIAQVPSDERDGSRLMTLDKSTGEHSFGQFRDLETLLKPGDLLLMNDSRVLPARLVGARKGGGAAEVLLLRELSGGWECLVKPGRRIREGARLTFGGGEMVGVVVRILDNGNRLVRFQHDGVFLEVLERLGRMPLPPYIKRDDGDPERYQTVYSKHPGSAAAPTAGLHFTPEMLQRLSAKGIEQRFVTLHVGLGTFRPVAEDELENHHMHSEFYVMPDDTAAAVTAARREGRRIVCVGTTSCRVLESCADGDGSVRGSSGWTDIFIYPGYKFKAVDALITNFHLPESTLIMLISALAGRENVLAAYNAAIAERMRFFSFGDACFIY